ncbi:hypothetical protein NL676_028235 [Syzygium grande]|nr:hypothetical protein NL676_028235 [Syzygium grande]
MDALVSLGLRKDIPVRFGKTPPEVDLVCIPREKARSEEDQNLGSTDENLEFGVSLLFGVLSYLRGFCMHRVPMPFSPLIVALLDEEKILPIAKHVTAVGHCFLKNGIPEIKSCNDLPYFLTEMTKDQMVNVLAFRTKILFWSSIFLGSASIGILGFAFVRWKEWRRRRQHEQLQQSRAAVDEPNTPIAEDESEDKGESTRNPGYHPMSHLQAFWALFLLFYLGVTDTVTAYSLEDDDL